MSKSFEEMLNNLCLFFSRIRESELKLNRQKCVLFQREVEYLVHIVSENGKKTDLKKTDIPVSTIKKKVLGDLLKGFQQLLNFFIVLQKRKLGLNGLVIVKKSFSHLKTVLSTLLILFSLEKIHLSF